MLIVMSYFIYKVQNKSNIVSCLDERSHFYIISIIYYLIIRDISFRRKKKMLCCPPFSLFCI